MGEVWSIGGVEIWDTANTMQVVVNMIIDYRQACSLVASRFSRLRSEF